MLLCCLLSHTRLLAGQCLSPHAPAGAGDGTRCSPWVPSLRQARQLRVQGLRLGHKPSLMGSSVLPHPIPQHSAEHVQAMAYTIPPYPADSTTSQPKRSQQKSSSASITDYPAGIARNSSLAGINSCSHTSQASYHSSSPLGWMGQSLWAEMLTSLPTY